MKYTPEQLRKIYLSLPKDVQDAIFSVDSAETIQAIAKKNNLNVAQMGELADETGLLMLGLTKTGDFIANLAQRMNVDKVNAKNVADEINSQIFSRIRESLKKIQGIVTTPALTSPEAGEVRREEIIKEIEKDESASSADKIPAIMQGTIQVKDEVFTMPKEEKKYQGVDPYHEAIDPREKKL